MQMNIKQTIYHTIVWVSQWSIKVAGPWALISKMFITYPLNNWCDSSELFLCNKRTLCQGLTNIYVNIRRETVEFGHDLFWDGCISPVDALVELRYICNGTWQTIYISYCIVLSWTYSLIMHVMNFERNLCSNWI